jgi:hypothetical protein
MTAPHSRKATHSRSVAPSSTSSAASFSISQRSRDARLATRTRRTCASTRRSWHHTGRRARTRTHGWRPHTSSACHAGSHTTYVCPSPSTQTARFALRVVEPPPSSWESATHEPSQITSATVPAAPRPGGRGLRPALVFTCKSLRTSSHSVYRIRTTEARRHRAVCIT